MNNTGKIALGILVGTVVGGTLGILFAPKKGAKTRAALASKAHEMGTVVKKNYQTVKDSLGMNKRNLKEEMIG
jgi:gas vesicle protein